MPWSLDFMSLLTVLVVAFFAGFGWSAGCWLWALITSGIRRSPS
jgi:hypothetical protein